MRKCERGTGVKTQAAEQIIMCILCVVSRLSRRIITVLRWLVVPVIVLWAFSQMLQPSLRFEVTFPRLACVFVLLVSSGWHEFIFPRLFAWRARRSALVRERKKVEAQMAAKRLKEAIRRCRNCLTAFRDQTPGSGKFMCAYCGHVSRRPVLDITGVALGKGGPGNIENYRRISSSMGTVQGAVRGGKCSGESYPGIFIFIVKVLDLSFFFIRWLSKKTRRERSWSEGRALNSSCKADTQKCEDKCNFLENKGEKAKRKAKEKRQARLEKKMLEEEERKQREEVARLVEERRRLRNEKLEIEKESEREAAPEKDWEIRIESGVGKKRQVKQQVKEKVFGKDNLVADVGEMKNKIGNEKEEKGNLYNNEESGKNKVSKPIAHHGTQPMKNVKNSRAPWLETGFKTNGHTMKRLINGITRFGTSRYLAPPKYSSLHPRSSSYSSRVTLGCVEGFGVKSVKTDDAVDSSIHNGSVGSLGLNYGQSVGSVWNGTACSKNSSKGSAPMYEDTCKKQPTLKFSNRCSTKHTNNHMDRSLGVQPSQLPVGVELQPVSPVTTQTKSWQHLFKGPLTSSRTSHSSNFGSHLEQGKHGEIQSKSFAVQVMSWSPSSSDIHSALPEPIQLAPAAVTSTCSITMSVPGSVSESPDPSGFISPHDYVPAATLTTDIESTLPSDRRATGVLSSNCAPISAPSHRPAQIPSPLSKMSPKRNDDNSHANGDHLPPIAELWSLPSLALDGSLEISEQKNCQMWDMPQYGKSKFCKPFPWFSPVPNMFDQERNLHHPLPQSIVQLFDEIENHLPADLLSQLEDGSPNHMSGDAIHMPSVIPRDSPWLNQPDHKSKVEGWNELDSHLLVPSFVNCFKEGTIQHSLDAAHGNEYEQSPVNFPPRSDLQDGAKTNCSTETTIGS